LASKPNSTVHQLNHDLPIQMLVCRFCLSVKERAMQQVTLINRQLQEERQNEGYSRRSLDL